MFYLSSWITIKIILMICWISLLAISLIIIIFYFSVIKKIFKFFFSIVDFYLMIFVICIILVPSRIIFTFLQFFPFYYFYEMIFKAILKLFLWVNQKLNKLSFFSFLLWIFFCVNFNNIDLIILFNMIHPFRIRFSCTYVFQFSCYNHLLLYFEQFKGYIHQIIIHMIKC